MERVRIYWNLHKKVWSVMKKGIVIYHMNDVVLTNVRFIVNQGGRNRVVREKKKNVHAFAEGILENKTDREKIKIDGLPQISYNPYKNPFFFSKEDEEIVLTANKVFMKDRKIFVLE